MTKAALTKLEQKLYTYLSNPTPEPKYKLWQTVQYKARGDRKGEISEGRICGCRFTRVAIAFAENCDPGWDYNIETGEEGDDIEIIHEDRIIGEVE
ncbi:MAG: hypothetical protein KME43_16310 [Myxacorys chilensis ATA2-1-KO14]|nr:hypothetical protein [Myxacorys chilensis ATA2-1-KO14]